MVKTYYKNEWQALIDEAERIGCKVTYGRYGDRAEIDSTDRERRTGPRSMGGAYPQNAAGEH